MAASPIALAEHPSIGKPLPRFFYVLERLLKDVNSPGGRIVMLLLLVLLGFFFSWLGVSGARELGSAVLIRLMFVLARPPHRR